MDIEENLEENGEEGLDNSVWTEDMEDSQIKDFKEGIVQFLTDWERRKRMAAVQLVCYVAYTIHIRFYYHSTYVDKNLMNIGGDRKKVRNELMKQLSMKKKYCHDIVRMGPLAFLKLCELLRETNRLKDNKNSGVEEQVAKFLYVLAHGTKNRVISFFFRRSGEIISRHFHDVLRAIITLEDQFLKQPTGAEVPEQILNNRRFYPYFKDCVGAIDGTHIRVLACCILHNFLMEADPDQQLLDEVDQDLSDNLPNTEEVYEKRNDNENAKIGAYIRNGIAQRMWEDYLHHREAAS